MGGQLREAELDELVAQAMVDAYGDEERLVGLYTTLAEQLAVPFKRVALGVKVRVKKVDFVPGSQIMAVCTRGRHQQAISILDLPLPDPPPEEAERTRRTGTGDREGPGSVTGRCCSPVAVLGEPGPGPTVLPFRREQPVLVQRAAEAASPEPTNEQATASNRIFERDTLPRKELRRRFCDRGWRFAHNGVTFTGASSVVVPRYRYRDSKIPTLWTPNPAADIRG